MNWNFVFSDENQPSQPGQLLAMLTREKWKKVSFAHWYQVSLGLIPLARSQDGFRKGPKSLPHMKVSFCTAKSSSTSITFVLLHRSHNSKVERTNEDLFSKRSYNRPDWCDHIWTELFHKDKSHSLIPTRPSCSAASDIKKHLSTVDRKKSVPNLIVKTTITVVKLLITQ